MDFLTLAECHNLNSDYLAVSFSDDAAMSRFLFIFLFLALADFRLFAQEIVPNPGRPFDLRKVKRLESGPAGHVYALDDENRLALIRFDSLPEADSLKISATIVKVIDFNSWLGNAKTQVQVEFSSSSADGKNEFVTTKIFPASSITMLRASSQIPSPNSCDHIKFPSASTFPTKFL